MMLPISSSDYSNRHNSLKPREQRDAARERHVAEFGGERIFKDMIREHEKAAKAFDRFGMDDFGFKSKNKILL
jgi:hypothetical protein